MAVNEVHHGVAMVQGGDVSLNGDNTGLVEETEPEGGEDVEDVPECEERLVTKDPSTEFVGGHEDDCRKNRKEEAWLLVRDYGEDDDGKDRGHHSPMKINKNNIHTLL